MDITTNGWLLTTEITTEDKPFERMAIKLSEIVAIVDGDEGAIIYLRNAIFYCVNEKYEELMFHIIGNY